MTLIALVAAALASWLRARPQGRSAAAIRYMLALALTALVSTELFLAARGGWLALEAVLPFQLCDAALVLAIGSLLTRWRLGSEVLYFWALSGTALAVVSPDLSAGFPRWEFVVFFGLHGLVIVSAVVLAFGLGLTPRRGAALRVWWITNGYAAAVGLVNLFLGTNYLYLRARPETPTLLDLFGPWPTYLIVSDALALALFVGLSLPFRCTQLEGAQTPWSR